MRVSGDGSIANVGIAQNSINEFSPELNFHLEGCLATEASMVVLDTLELIVQVCTVWLEQLAELREIMALYRLLLISTSGHIKFF